MEKTHSTGIGTAYPQGATATENGVNFALFSEFATGISIDFFKRPEDREPYETVEVTEKDNFVWHAFVSGINPGTLYGYRVDGPYHPELGHRFNKNKLLLDPYAKAMSGKIQYTDDIFGYVIGSEGGDLTYSETDDAGFVPKSVVTRSWFDWNGDTHPRLPWNKTIIYETHVKGISQLGKEIEESSRGTYRGLASDHTIQYLQDLGITAVELLPVHEKVDSRELVEKGLSNYWGYNTIGYFAPESTYSSSKSPGDQIDEFKNMVSKLHANNIEVILDVVYNHTGEGNHLGPTLSFRGIDNYTYYRVSPEDPRFYYDFTGTGNSLDARQPQVLQLIMDSLRYWVEEMHVDGFRFDLAATLARQLHEVDQLSAFFNIIHQDPVISRVKLIAEPWDLGPGGYQVGQFPMLWAEWNGKYRDRVRHYWRNDGNHLGAFATRLSGSPDLYELSEKKPHASINYVTSHDGFTLQDLVSYRSKHNEANIEENGDGTEDNISDNFGVEGETEDAEIIRQREKRKRNFLITLLTSQGAPMILGGDEIGRTQRGNNNAYCHDNEISWYDWDLDEGKKSLLDFTRRLIRLRLKYHVLRRRNFFRGEVMPGTDTKDVVWRKPDGTEMSLDDWDNPPNNALGVLLSGAGIEATGYEPEEILDDDLLILFNPTPEAVEFSVPEHWSGQEILIDSIPEDTYRFPIQMDWKKITLEAGSSAILKEKQQLD